VRLLLTPGQAGDAPQAETLLSDLSPRNVIADAAYDSDAIRQRIQQTKGKACIRPNPTRKTKKRYDKERYKHRNIIERFFGAIKQFRRVATRYDKKAENFMGFVWLAALLVGLK
jgi:putative transposase